MQKRILSTLLLASTVSLTACAGGSPNAAQVPATGEAPMAAAPAAAPITQPAPVIDQLAGQGAQGESSQKVSAPATAGETKAPAATTPAAQAPLELTGIKYEEEDSIVFHSNRSGTEGNNDIFMYKPGEGTIVALPGLNTQFNEINARVSDNGKWIVFQRALPLAGIPGLYQQDILMYNTENHLVNNLQGLNTELGDEYMADISDDGRKIVFVRSAFSLLNGAGPGQMNLTPVRTYQAPEVHLYDVRSGDDWTVPGANANMPLGEVHWPTLSANGSKIAYSATVLPGLGTATDSTGTPTGGSAVAFPLPPARIFVYDINSFKQITPPFVNEGLFSSYNPDLSSDGTKMLFVSNRLGVEDIYEVDFRTGMLDNLQFANVNFADNQHPRYLGCDTDRILFQVKPPFLGTRGVELRIYDRESGELDMLPIINNARGSNAIRAPQTELLP